MSTRELIKTLITDYKADRITWHDMQDIVEAHVMQQDNKGMTFDINILHNRMTKTNKILEKIENAIKQ